jgi:hypothetical protein
MNLVSLPSRSVHPSASRHSLGCNLGGREQCHGSCVWDSLFDDSTVRLAPLEPRLSTHLQLMAHRS